MKKLEKKVALITGGARGMGAAIALKFADEGCSSVIADILDEPGEKTAEEIKKRGQEALYIHCDVSDGAQVRKMVDQAIDTFGKIGIMVISSGIGTNPTPLEALTEENWDRAMNVNAKGTFLCIQAISPHMMENRSGAIVCIVSVAGTTGSAFNWQYRASKAAQLQVARCASVLMAPYDVRVNVIHPGMVLTDMSAVFSGPEVEDVVAFQTGMAEKGVPLHRIGTTDDIAKAALFLASDESSYITGDSLFVSGGSGLIEPGGGPKYKK